MFSLIKTAIARLSGTGAVATKIEKTGAICMLIKIDAYFCRLNKKYDL